MKLKAILEDELLNGEIKKKWEVFETDEELWNFLLNAYGNRYAQVNDEEAEEKEEKKTSRKTKKSE